ncbi:MAG: pyridoxamine 5'-phosphate oxidase [Wenzhouxiangellaceae bacterium]|nr:pyridoxamine 5'-phosphate oxidase [Wenzhouxiangellaceae bacterium]MBS3823860.1 pyridoxamine 5'-phosphate oxidase [Wenzhouxiangellaceae bacterium]
MRLNDEITQRFSQGFDQAVAAGMPEPTAMTLSTVDERGRPSSRVVLLKSWDADGFVFYTNTRSRKGRHLAANAGASLLFWWRENEQQVLIEGRAAPVSDAEADAYFASRPRGSQVGAWASIQSSELENRQTLLDRVAELEDEYRGRDIPRPPHWSGFRVDPDRIEFWYGREFRLHERILFEADRDGWTRRLLYP